MEEILFFLLQIVIEITIDGIAYLLTSKSIAKQKSQSGTGSKVGTGVPYAIVGGVLGGASALLYSHVLLPQAWMRIANLLITPAVFGWLAMCCLPRPAASTNAHQFWNAYLFALFFAATRLIFAAN